MQLAYVYCQLIYRVEAEPDTDVILNERDAVSAIKAVKSIGVTICFGEEKPMRSVLSALIELIKAYRVMNLNSEEAEPFKVCSALFEAEREL